MATTFRVDVVTGLVGVLNAVKAAHPTLLRDVRTARPDGSASEKPVAYIGTRNEQVAVDSGIMRRVLTPQIVVLDTFSTNEETLDRMDVLVDILVDAFVAAPHAGGANTVVGSNFTITDTEQQFGEAILRAVIFTFADALDQEGRP